MSSDYLISGGTVISKKLTYSVREAAEVLGVSASKMYEVAKSRGFPTIMVGRRMRISVKGLEAWIEKQAQVGYSGKYIE